MLIWSLIIIIGIFLYLTHTKIEFLEIRNEKKKIKAEVIEYRKEKGLMRNDYSEMEYPYVKIDLENEDEYEYSVRKLRYANSLNRSFHIGQKVNVFWYGSDLLYWDAYENGIYKYLPKRWNIFSSEE